MVCEDHPTVTIASLSDYLIHSTQQHNGAAFRMVRLVERAQGFNVPRGEG